VTPYGDRLIEVAEGVPVLRKAPPRPDPSVLHPGQYSRLPDGSVWEVEHVTSSSAEVRCVAPGKLFRSRGERSTWSRSSVGHRLVSEDDANASARSAAEAKALDRDETRCPSCWPGEPGEVDGQDRGRDPRCPSHAVTEEAVERAARGATRRRKEERPEDVTKVLALRAEGLAYHAISAAMGWTDDVRGSRAYRIVKS
jgi:hypothetical protein